MRKIAIVFTVCIMTSMTSCGQSKNSLTCDDGVVINGVKWATRNVDEFGTFAKNPENAGKFYQWNRKKAWNATDTLVVDWDSSALVGDTWEKENDPCPKGWRVPTRTELQKLVATGSVLANMNGVEGRLFGTVPNQIFLPIVGWRSASDGKFNNIGTWAYYWSSTQVDTELAWLLSFVNFGNSNVFHGNRMWGVCLRCVSEESTELKDEIRVMPWIEE